jgi:small-conductance mechanosensitive channel
MKKLFFILAVTVLLLSAVFSPAQEGEAGEAQALSAEEEPVTLESPVSEEPVEIAPEESTEHTIETVTEHSADTAADTVADVEAAEETIKIMHFIPRLGIAMGIIAVQILLIWGMWRLFKLLNIKVENSGKEKIKPLTIKKLRILSTKQIIAVIHFLLRILKYIITVIQLFLTVPIVFSLFPATRNIAFTIFGYVLTPVKNIAISVIKYIPNLFTIVVIIVITRYVLKGLKFFSIQIARGKLVLPGFYADWAMPTYKILQVFLIAFTIAIVYPYLPGSDSRIFQGVSVFVGLVFSLGSSSAIGNLVAGLVITYMRPFKIGDRVQIKDKIGFVTEKNMMVVRLKTHKNEYITFPNLTILGSDIINFNTSSAEDKEGLILHTEITYGYSTPWRTIHEILINAALATEYVQKKPIPFVLQTALDDFYARYQINCYTKEVDKVPAIYSLLYENIQNGFREAGLDMTTPHYEIFMQNDAKLD